MSGASSVERVRRLQVGRASRKQQLDRYHSHQPHDTQTLGSHTHKNDRTDLDDFNSYTQIESRVRGAKASGQNRQTYRHSQELQSELCKSFLNIFSPSHKKIFNQSRTKWPRQVHACLQSFNFYSMEHTDRLDRLDYLNHRAWLSLETENRLNLTLMTRWKC